MSVMWRLWRGMTLELVYGRQIEVCGGRVMSSFPFFSRFSPDHSGSSVPALAEAALKKRDGSQISWNTKEFGLSWNI